MSVWGEVSIWVNIETILNKKTEPDDLQCSSNISQTGEEVSMEVKYHSREFLFAKTKPLFCACASKKMSPDCESSSPATSLSLLKWNKWQQHENSNSSRRKTGRHWGKGEGGNKVRVEVLAGWRIRAITVSEKMPEIQHNLISPINSSALELLCVKGS